ncbi:hypothetical protein Hamer_G000225, partial [Homarus americanus]
GEKVLGWVREAAYAAGVGTREHEALIVLIARMEATPLAVHNWGMESLSARTLVSLSKVVVTYLVVLLQFCSYSSSLNHYVPNDAFVFTAYDHCFCSNNTSS